MTQSFVAPSIIFASIQKSELIISLCADEEKEIRANTNIRIYLIIIMLKELVILILDNL
jgi:hypothetical protein